MNSELDLKAFILRAISNAGGFPLPESTLRDSVKLAFRHCPPTAGDLGRLIQRLDSEGYISGTQDTFARQTVWTITTKGTIQLNQLG